MDFWLKLFDTSDFPERWHCGDWTAGHGWLHILSDLGVWSAYFAIPLILTYFLLRRSDLPFRGIFLLFAAFILFCGTTHLMEAAIFWWPAYRLAGVIKLLTALVSWGTVIALIRVAPTALAMRSPEELEQEVAARRTAEAELQATNAQLDRRIHERTAELAAANAKLQTERDWFSTTLASIGDAVITTDGDGRVTSLNAVASTLTGWSPPEAMGQPLATVFQIVHEETRKELENPALNALKTGRTVGLQNHTILIAKDRSERNIDDSAAPIKDDAGTTAGVVLIFRDISERRHLQRQIAEQLTAAQFLASIVESSDDAIVSKSLDGTIQSWNAAAERVFGYSADEAVGRHVSLIIPPERIDEEDQIIARIRSGERVEHFVTKRARSDGRIIDVSLTISPIKDEAGRIVGASKIARDITEQKRTEEELQHQRELLKQITDNATTAIFVMDEQARCTFMNPAAEAMTGYEFGAAQARNLHDLIHHTRTSGSPYPQAECPIERVLHNSTELRNHEDVFVRKNGEFFPVMCNVRPMTSQTGRAGSVIEVLDLTQQKRIAELLRESESRFTQLADAIPQLVWMALPDGHIDWYNSRWYEYTGTTLEEMEGWGWQSVHDPEALPGVLQEWNESIATGKPFEMVFPMRGADGAFRPFLTRIVPFRDDEGNIVRWFGTNTDISEQQRMQEQLGQVATQLSEADRRKDEFLATLAHELRNPLAPIRTGLELMRMGIDDTSTLEDIRSTMERQTEQLIMLVDDLLDVSRITRGKLELRKSRVVLSDVVDSAVETCRPSIAEARHDLSIDLPGEPVHLHADPFRLAQVISNLLSNAAKYTPQGGRISLTARQEESDVVISVTDTGIGIPSDMMDRIFEMFAQIDQPIEQGDSGLGIGLTIVRSLVEMHGGSIEAHSGGPGEGSEFRIRLPIEVEPRRRRSPDETTGEGKSSMSKHRILVADDNKAAANMLQKLLAMLGHDVRTAHDGQQAIDVSAEFRPELVLLDLGMPKLNGYEVARHLREQDWGRDIVLAALTGWGQDEDKQRTKEAGFDHHLVKPTDPAELERLIAELD